MAKYDRTAIRQIVTQNLGGGRVAIELGDEHFNRGVDAAMKMLERLFPQYGYVMVNVMPGGNKTRVPVPNIIGILDVTYFTSGLRLEEAPYYTRYTDRYMELADMQDTQKVFGDQPDWHSQWEFNETSGEDEMMLYTVFTRSSFVDTFARIPNIACVQFAWAIESTDDPKLGVGRIPRDLRQWVEDYATAFCRTIMGDVRGKFGGVPGADDGSVLPVDGGSQVARGTADMRRLEEDLRGRQRQMPLIVD